jgi:hypothetical protein
MRKDGYVCTGCCAPDPAPRACACKRLFDHLSDKQSYSWYRLSDKRSDGAERRMEALAPVLSRAHSPEGRARHGRPC